ncbi:ABC transporter ATP-binding protein [Tomitella fengzijianii]|uniref:ABC transporter ATP-binding protein n=1 Tax=Tomitella fengzijianii TaxID=2597660 RepID=A0A516X8J7_9ACTN|nr:ABC transporter ATP-binding protein [Tomitella fengzijianii]QDQ99399.1 ABC transporter ATP-binding protein [Tomitella fengzijianii]
MAGDAVAGSALPGNAAVDCAGLTVVRGGATVVDDVTLRIGRGDWVSVVGPNGAGKTTLLHALAGLLTPAGGTAAGASVTGVLSVSGADPRRTRRREMARKVALMPQRPVVPEGITVAELVSLGRTPHVPRFGVESAADKEAVARVLRRLDLEELASRQAARLSGGELQRVVLGRALAQQPEVLLLDEPTSALDIGHQQQVLDLVESLRAGEGITVVAAMHDLTLAAHYGRRMVMMADARVIADGGPEDVLDPGRIGRVYGARVEVLRRGGTVVVLPAGLAASGSESGTAGPGAGR